VRDFLPVLAVAILVIVIAVAGYWAFFNEEDRSYVTLQRVVGPVSLHSGDERLDATGGESLEPGDRIISGDGGQAVLSFGASSSIVLEEGSSLKLRGADAEGVEVELEGGRARATVRPGDGTLGVLNGDRRVEASDGTFEVGVDDGGGLVVQTEEGEVQLQGFGERTGLGPGERLSLAPGGDPWVTDAQRELLLDLDPGQTLIARANQVLTGTTDPYARVLVQGGQRPVSERADAKGRFTLTVPLHEGENQLKVIATDALGQEREVAWVVAVDTRPPEAVHIEVGGP